MFLFLLCVIILAFIFCYLAHKNFYNPLFLFIVVWSLILLSNKIGYYKLGIIDNNIYLLVLISIIAYILGYIGNSFVNINLFNNGFKFNKMLDLKKFYILSFILLSYELISLVKIVLALGAGISPILIRSRFSTIQSGILYVSPIEFMLRMYIITPIATLYSAISTWSLFYVGNKNIKLVKIVSLVLFVLYALLELSRTLFIIYFIQIGFSYMISKSKKNKILLNKKKKRKNRKFIIFAFIVIIIVILRITLSRQTKSINFLGLIQLNYGGNLHLLQYKLEEFLESPKYTYGFSFFMGIIRLPITIIFKLLLRIDYPNIYDIASNIGVSLQRAIYLGEGIYYNALVTPIYYFYVDFGVISVFLGFFLYGYTSKKIYATLKNNSEYYKIIYLIFLVSIYYMIARWQFFLAYYVFSFFYAYFLFNKERG